MPNPSSPALRSGSAVLLLSALVAAQGMPEPSAELEKLEPMVGTFAGEGVASGPGGQEMPWTATSEARWILGGFFVEEIVTIEVGAPVPLQMRSITGWDAENERMVSASYGNSGVDAGLEELHWIGDDTVVQSYVSYAMAEPKLTRIISTFGDDAVDFRVEEASGDGPLRTTVSGTMKRTGDDGEGAGELIDQAFPFGTPPPAEMRELRPLVGEFTTAGWMVMPGMGRLELTGSESMQMRAGGHVLEAVAEGTAGDTPPWKGLTLISWDPHSDGYRMVMFSNYGEVSDVDMVWADDGALLSYGVNRYLGLPMVGRSVMTLADDGPQSIDSHTIHGLEDPVHSFHMEYTPKDAK